MVAISLFLCSPQLSSTPVNAGTTNVIEKKYKMLWFQFQRNSKTPCPFTNRSDNVYCRLIKKEPNFGNLSYIGSKTLISYVQTDIVGVSHCEYGTVCIDREKILYFSKIGSKKIRLYGSYIGIGYENGEIFCIISDIFENEKHLNSKSVLFSPESNTSDYSERMSFLKTELKGIVE